jgi:Holliday junction resolvase
LLRDVSGLPDSDIRKLDAAALTEKIQRVHKGFSVEYEFAAIASWLGRCSLVSQLDNVLHMSAKYRAPDFMVVANHKGLEVPFLVEVKSKDADKLVWSAKYLESLQAFAALVKLPLLVAWKRGRLWVLADSTLMLKRVTAFHLSFEEAMKRFPGQGAHQLSIHSPGDPAAVRRI